MAVTRSMAQKKAPKVRGPGRKLLSGWTAEVLKDFRALDIPGQDCTWGDLQRVHPLFSDANFVISGSQYERIVPALCLASAFLHEPQASVFWYSLVFGPRQPVPHIVRGGKRGRREATEEPWSRFLAVPVGANEWQKLERFWQQMRRAITIRFRDLSGTGASGETVRTEWGRTYPPGRLLRSGREASITLSISFLNTLRDFATPTPKESLPHYLRQHHLLAVTLLHEICHAIHIVRYKQDVEPFFKDHRQAELGFAWEQSVLNGKVYPVANKKLGIDNTLWGLHFNRWPDHWNSEEAHMVHRWPTRLTDHPVLKASRRHWSTAYLVTMDYIQSLVMSLEWKEIAKYGPERLKMVKGYGLRTGSARWEDWQHAGSSGASSHFKPESYALWSEDTNEKYKLVRRHSTDSDSDSDSEEEAKGGDPMDIDTPEDDTNKNKRRRSSSDAGENAPEAGKDPKRPRISTGGETDRDPKRPRLSTGVDCVVC